MAIPRHAEDFGIPRERAIMPAGPAYQAYRILQFAFTVAPVLAGLDKFFDLLVKWDNYLHPAIPRMLGIESHTITMGIGVVEIIAGLIVAFKPSVGGWIVGLWLLGIVANLLAIPSYFDIALRDFGLALAAFALARLGRQYDGVETVDEFPA